jgi:hypothetical protein
MRDIPRQQATANVSACHSALCATRRFPDPITMNTTPQAIAISAVSRNADEEGQVHNVQGCPGQPERLLHRNRAIR